ncbi:MAG: beta-L-arabinofuranosidase domain-containing protein [Janthinobacterium lividum]
MSRVTRRQFVQSAACTLVANAAKPTVTHASSEKPGKVGTMPTKLAPAAFHPLALGQIRPVGWLRRQLRIQADGMGGHLDEFWPDVGSNSGWLGGTGESWERGPYFLDGLVPLAWQLEDAVLKAKAMRFINWTLDHQQPSGMIGPGSNDDWWPRMVMVKALAQYEDATGDPRVTPVLTRYFHHQLAAMPERPLQEWGKYRWQDEVYVVQWLYSRTRDPKLLELAHLLQQQGFDWVTSFREFKYTTPTTRDLLDARSPSGNKPAGMQTHGVNNGQALKAAAVQFRLSGNAAEKVAYYRQLGALDRFHGQPNGMFSCDEHLAGLNPSQGTELCTVVETLFSMEVALATFGEAGIADRIERIAYNALPGTFTDNMWAHQYDQQANQISCSLNSKPWTTNSAESNLYGLEPHFGCCTANFHQGWPKLTSSLWMRTADSRGLVAAIYAPCEVRTQMNGQNVHLIEETEYPFRKNIRITVNLSGDLRFPLMLRIPQWAEQAVLSVNGRAVDSAVVPGTFAEVNRTWKSGDVVELELPMQPTLTRGYHGSATISRGPLVFSFSPGTNWVKLRDRGITADWQVFPRQQWNYALRVDEASVRNLFVHESSIGSAPFSAANPAVRLSVPARIVDSWRSEDGVAAPVPEKLKLEAGSPSQPDELIELIPYGASKLRITAFPTLGAVSS